MLCGKSQQGLKIQQKSACFHKKCDNETAPPISTSRKNASKMDDVLALCKKYDLRLVEDCAQSHGACFDGKMTGTFGDVGCFSFYPSKNIGAFGDAGAIVCNDDKIAEDFRVFRSYGSEKRYYNKVVGANSRLDEMQAGFLRVRLPHLDAMNAETGEIIFREQ